MSNSAIAIHLFLQIGGILAICRATGWFGQRFLGQTQVVMEMITGILLGPSVLGFLAPGAQAWLFPKQLLIETSQGAVPAAHPNMTILFALAQLGLVLYMFVVGLEFDLGLLSGRLKSASLVSGAGIFVPLVLSVAMLPYLAASHQFFPVGISSLLIWLFTGASMAITAFPVLSRILYERGLVKTPLGTLTLASGLIDDAVAWCLLALVLALLQKNPYLAVFTIGGGIFYAGGMLTLGRKLLRGFERTFARQRELTAPTCTLAMIVLMVCSCFTEGIGIHAVFGAFLCGIAMPKGAFAQALTQKIQHLATSLLVPLFFVYSGLNTKIDLLNTPALWALTFVVILVSVLGKGVACMVAARASGEDWHNSALIGTLMNTRGMVELILLNIGLERGLITSTFFTIMVIMAVVTTSMTSPIYGVLERVHSRRRVDVRGSIATG